MRPLLCSVSAQMHLDAHQDAFAPHPSFGRFRSTAGNARCRVIGASSNNDTEGHSRKATKAGSAAPTRLSAQPVGLQDLLQPKSVCNPASQIATRPYSSLPSKGSHHLPRGSQKVRCTNRVHSTPLANTAKSTKQTPRSAASLTSSTYPLSPTEHRPQSAAKLAYSRHHSAGQVRGEKADSAAEAES
ncbi:TPA: hypothetical protein ACH3X2_005446 [Trebouxia sp. C0005]